jgi:spermidine synthase
MSSPGRLAIGLMAAMLVALEIVWTRIFSAEFFYSFAFLTVSMALLGLGLGALLLRLWPAATQPRTLAVVALLASASAALAPLVVLRLDIDFTALWDTWHNLPLLLVGVLALSLPFLAGGGFIAAILKTNRGDISGIYMADLVGAALGGLTAVWLMNSFGVPAAAVLCCTLGALAGWRGSRLQRGGTLLLLLGLAAFSRSADHVLVPARVEPAPVIARHWDALGKITVYVYGATARGINIDNAANMLLYRARSNWRESTPESLRFRLDFRSLIRDRNLQKVMIIGAGGGSDVMQAKLAGAGEIHAVEVNRALNQMLLEGEQAEFSGHLYSSPGVHVVNEDARTYSKRHAGHFDLIVSRSANTFAALSSGAFALAENFIFTTEAFVDFYRALSDRGVLFVEHQVYIPRVASAVMAALRDMGVEHPERRFAVYDLPTMHRQVLVLSREADVGELIEHTLTPLFAAADSHSRLLHPVDRPQQLISRIIADGWQAHWDDARIDISPPTDDRPFVAQMGRWDQLDARRPQQAMGFEFTGFPLAKLMILTVLAVAVAVGVPILLLPMRAEGARLQAADWLYFAAIGIGYMVVEVVWIQQYNLFIGNSAHTFVIVLLGLLLSSGAGSFCSGRFGDRLPFAFVATWLVVHLLAFPMAVAFLGSLDFAWRVALSCLSVAPAGFFMGMAFPKAAARVGELVDWGFAVNGVASVFGATLAIFIAIHAGFAVTLLVGVFCYLVAMLLLGRMRVR